MKIILNNVTPCFVSKLDGQAFASRTPINFDISNYVLIEQYTCARMRFRARTYTRTGVNGFEHGSRLPLEFVWHSDIEICTLIKLHLARLSNKSHGLLMKEIQQECFSTHVRTSIDSVFEIHRRHRARLEIIQLWLNDLS